MKHELRMLNAAKVGWTYHAMWESPVADLHRIEFGTPGPNTAGGYMGCINRDGSLRPHHGAINDFM